MTDMRSYTWRSIKQWQDHCSVLQNQCRWNKKEWVSEWVRELACMYFESYHPASKKTRTQLKASVEAKHSSTNHRGIKRRLGGARSLTQWCGRPLALSQVRGSIWRGALHSLFARLLLLTHKWYQSPPCWAVRRSWRFWHRASDVGVTWSARPLKGGA